MEDVESFLRGAQRFPPFERTRVREGIPGRLTLEKLNLTGGLFFTNLQVQPPFLLDFFGAFSRASSVGNHPSPSELRVARLTEDGFGLDRGVVSDQIPEISSVELPS